MPRNGSGTYNRVPGSAYTNGTVNDGTEVDNEMNDLATALTESLTANGEKQPIANQPMAGFRHTAVGNPTALNQYDSAANAQNSVLTTLTGVAGTNTITATAPLLMAAYAAGQMFHFAVAGANTGAVTLNINSLGAKAVVRNGGTALISGDIAAGSSVVVIYDGTDFEIIGLTYAALLAANNTFTGANTHTGVETFNNSRTNNQGAGNDAEDNYDGIEADNRQFYNVFRRKVAGVPLNRWVLGMDSRNSAVPDGLFLNAYDDAGVLVDTVFKLERNPAIARFQRAGGSMARVLTFGATVNTDASLSNAYKITYTSSFTLANPTNLRDGFSYRWILLNGVGAASLTYGSLFKFPAGADKTVTATNGAVDNLVCSYDLGLNILVCNLGKGYA